MSAGRDTRAPVDQRLKAVLKAALTDPEVLAAQASANADEQEKRERRRRELARSRDEKAPRVDPAAAAAYLDSQVDHLATATPSQEKTLRDWRSGRTKRPLLATVEKHVKQRGGDPAEVAAVLLEPAGSEAE